MQISMPHPGIYVVAVSGGVDSMALLQLLHAHNLAEAPKPYKLVVAHLNHGIRDDADKDRRLVQQVARDYQIPFVYKQIELGAGASEDAARQPRYKFLETVRQASNAQAIITAHHQNDVLETAVHNIVRGTGRKGITSLGSRPGFERPFLAVTKDEIINHAQANGVRWREDSTNTDTQYARNYIRHNIMPRLEPAARKQLHDYILVLRHLNKEIDAELEQLLVRNMVHGKLDRMWFVQLPHDVAKEVMASWLRFHCIANFDSGTIERLTVAAKVAQPGTQADVMNKASMHVWLDTLSISQ